ncbi:MAG: 50S ribosomal protein L13 [Candidatus Levyibacteriota bacterium]
MQNLTKPTKDKDITRNWHLIDVNNVILGRTATKIAALLMGKSKPYFAKNMDCGDYVVIINAKSVKVTGNKEKNKVYTSYSGYAGGLKSARLEEVRVKKPTEIVRHAVSGMLPKNKLRDQFLKRLYIFAEAEHPYGDKFKKEGK